jgi:hypothetical protein
MLIDEFDSILDPTKSNYNIIIEKKLCILLLHEIIVATKIVRDL